MDGQRFDELTRALATTSRRQVVKALAGGLLALLSSREAGAASCRGLPDFTPCGECKHCRNGRCVAGFDGLNCRACGVCQDGRCRSDDRRCGQCQRCRGHGGRCVPDPRQDLHPCGSDCHICDGGTCVPLPDGSACLDRDGTCCGGICLDTQNDNANCGGCGNACPRCWRCEGDHCVPDTSADGQPCPGPNSCGSCLNGECLVDVLGCPDPCTTCDEDTLTCVPRPEGAACAGECGTCQHGQCLPTGPLCVERYGICSSCEFETFTCIIDPDGTPCGNNPRDLECHTCQSGVCVPVADGTACAAGCGTCDGGVCVPVPDGTQCGVECGTCQNGQCLPRGGLCTQQHGPCSFCDAQTLTCVPADDGEVCSGCGTCQGGACVPDDSHCPVGKRCCPDGTCQPENCPCPGASDFTANQLCCPFGHEACGDVCCDPTAGEKCTSDGCCSIRRNESPCGPGFDPLNDLICCGPDETCCIGEGGQGYCCPGEPFTQLTCCFGGCCPEGWTCSGDCFHARGLACCPPSGPGHECGNCLPPSPGRRA